MKRKALAIFLTLLMLSCNSGLLLATHLCRGKAISTSLGFSTGMDCGMAKNCSKSSKKCNGFGFSAAHCCQQQIQQLSLKKEFSGTKHKLRVNDYPSLTTIPVFKSAYQENHSPSAVYLLSFTSPPNRLSLIQSLRL